MCEKNALIELTAAQNVCFVEIIDLLEVYLEVLNRDDRVGVTNECLFSEEATHYLLPSRVLHFHNLVERLTITKFFDDVDGGRLALIPRWREEAFRESGKRRIDEIATVVVKHIGEDEIQTAQQKVDGRDKIGGFVGNLCLDAHKERPAGLK